MGICKECGRECEGKWLDFGIGGYEFWGRTGVDVNWQYVSKCCEADILDDEGDILDPPEDDYDDYYPPEDD